MHGSVFNICCMQEGIDVCELQLCSLSICMLYSEVSQTCWRPMLMSALLGRHFHALPAIVMTILATSE